MIPETGYLHDVVVVGSIILLEGLLSVDNALGIASIASHLPKHQQKLALRLGIIGAYGFRGLALFFASFIAESPWLKLLGALYLVYLMASELTGRDEEAQEDASISGLATVAGPGLIATIFKIELMDLSLSLDNVVVAVAMSPGRMWPVYLGVFAGILALRFVAGWCIGLLERHPILEPTAFVLVGWVGFLLLWQEVPVAMGWVQPDKAQHIPSYLKFAGITLILGLALGSERSPALRRVLNLLGIGFRPIFRFVDFFGTIVKWPFLALSKKVLTYWRSKRSLT